MSEIKHWWHHVKTWNWRRNCVPRWRDDKTATMLGIAHRGCPVCGYGYTDQS